MVKSAAGHDTMGVLPVSFSMNRSVKSIVYGSLKTVHSAVSCSDAVGTGNGQASRLSPISNLSAKADLNNYTNNIIGLRRCLPPCDDPDREPGMEGK